MLKLHSRRKLPTLLLIDDDLVSREVTATVLTMNGFTVHTAGDGAASLEMLVSRACQPDVVLMDVQLPGLSGNRLIAELRARTNARVIVVSGSKPPSELSAAADGFLLKPFGIEEFQRLLESPAGQSVQANPSRLDPDQPVISAEVLAQFRGMMPESAVREIYSAVISDLAKRMRTLELAIAMGNDAEIRRIGHAIKGGCGMAGALQAARIGALFEEVGGEPESNQLDNRMALLNDLRTAAHSLERILDAEISTKDSV